MLKVRAILRRNPAFLLTNNRYLSTTSGESGSLQPADFRPPEQIGSSTSDASSLPDEAPIVIIGIRRVCPLVSKSSSIAGGGIIGCSIAYHLGKLGKGKQTVLLEKSNVHFLALNLVLF